MSVQTTPLRRLYARFFPRKAVAASLPRKAIEADFLPVEEKKELALRYLAEGEMALLQGNLKALPLFEAASNLDAQNPDIWFRQGLAFFEYGSEDGQEKALLVASKNFKIATQLKQNFFEAWVAWGNVLLQLGKFHDEHHFFIEAKDKYQKALKLQKGKPRAILGELYWDYGIVWGEIAKHSGEALDVRLAIDAFDHSEKHQTKPSHEFLNDCGRAYLEMGLLINDSRLYIKSIGYLKKSVKMAPEYFDGLMSLAEGYSQLYLITLNESYVTRANEVFQRAAKISPRDVDMWIDWGQILGTAGRNKKDPKLLRESIKKCAKAAQLDQHDPMVISQWVEALAILGEITSSLDVIIEAEHKIIKATDLYPDDPDLWHAYGICMMAFAKYYEDVDYYELAIEKIQNGLSLDRSDPELWQTLGLVHKEYANLTQDEDLIERACRFLTRALDLKPACPMLLFDAASAYLENSEIINDITSLEQAISLFEMLLQKSKEAILNHPEWLFGYARALEWLGDFTDEDIYFVRAIEVYSHVLLIDPDYPNIHYQIALTYVELGHSTGESEYYQRALNFFRLAKRQDPENDQVWLEWGTCLIDLAHHKLDTESMNELYINAEMKITEAGRLGNENAYYNLACLYSILGRTYESTELLYRSFQARALPSINELLDDDWLENVRSTPAFAQFLTALEAKLQQTREE